MDRWRLSVGVPVIEPHGVFTPNTFQAVYCELLELGNVPQ